MAEETVLIAGAGPTGMVLALWLTRQGISVRIIDKLASHVQQSRAMVVHARTLELYQQCNLADDLIAQGNKNTRINLHVKGKVKARFTFNAIGDDLTRYPWLLILPQDHHEALLEKHLEKAGVRIERECELVDFQQTADGVQATLNNAQCQQESCSARFLAGCDGARSTVREQLATPFQGGTYEKIFYVADVQASGKNVDREAHVALDSADFLVIFPYGQQENLRLIGTFQQTDGKPLESLHFDDVQQRSIHELGLNITGVNWFSTYRVHHRVASQFHQGNVFLLGDAAHVHSPVGGQGMNTGIGDAINLAWKLAAVIRREATPALLDSYQDERQAFARRLVNSTDKAFSMVSSESGLASTVRTRLFPLVAATVNRLPLLQRALFRVLSQTELNYRHSTFNAGKAGGVQGGDRLPWVGRGEEDNYASLWLMRWQVHVYGGATPAFQNWLTEHALPLHMEAWTARHSQVGLKRNAAYLIRPDGYVALASADHHEANIGRWLTQHGITLEGEEESLSHTRQTL